MIRSSILQEWGYGVRVFTYISNMNRYVFMCMYFIQRIKRCKNMDDIPVIYAALHDHHSTSLSIFSSLICSFQIVTMPLGGAGWR